MSTICYKRKLYHPQNYETYVRSHKYTRMYLFELLLLSKHQIDCCSLPGEASDKDCVFVKSAATRDWKIDSCTAENYYLCQYDSE